MRLRHSVVHCAITIFWLSSLFAMVVPKREEILFGKRRIQPTFPQSPICLFCMFIFWTVTTIAWFHYKCVNFNSFNFKINFPLFPLTHIVNFSFASCLSLLQYSLILLYCCSTNCDILFLSVTSIVLITLC